MTDTVDADLQYLIHFFTDKEHLFQTITMADPGRIEEISDKIAAQKGWYWFRYSQNDRQDYLERRRFVERKLYEGYTREYGTLKEKAPVYFYLRPNITKEGAIELGRKRIQYDGRAPQILMVKIESIEDTSNMTFTLNDSFTAYWKNAIESGIKCREEENGRVVLPDHNCVFPFSMVEEIHQKYKAEGMYYEVQIWDHDLLARINYMVLGEE